MLRAVRFACQLQFTLHPTVLDAMRTNAYRVSSVSAERVNSELGRAFSANPLMALDLLEDSGLLVHVLPEVAAMNGVTQNPNNHPEGDCLVHTKLLLAHLPNNTPLTLALSALFHDCGKPLTAVLKNGQNTFYSHADVGATLTREVLTRLKFSTDVVETVVSNVAQHMKFFEVQAMRRSTLLRFVRQNNFNELLELHRLDCLASNGDLSNHAFVVEFLNEQTAVDLAPAKLLNGNDLVGLGFTPGPFFKTLLEALETAQLEGQLTTREDAVAFVLNFGA